MKLKTVYVCSGCGIQTSKWSGQCLKCNGWNTLTEDVVDMSTANQSIKKTIAIKPTLRLKTVSPCANRLLSNIGELDRVLGGGFVHDAVVLLAGDPGIGKSTLTLQMCDKMAELGRSVLYFSGEESIEQISTRANRLNFKHDIHIVNQNNLEVVLSTIEAEKPGFVVVDSVQVMASENMVSQAGSISQVRYVAEQLMQVAKSNQIPILLIGHVTKQGQLAGPQALTHLVDTVLYLEGDKFHEFRLLRSTKNRFGAVDEVGVFRMETCGLMEVSNPSELFLKGRAEKPIGSVIVPILEGTRIFLVEVQALTSHTNFGYPKRTATGFDLNRLNMILAILQRYAKLTLDSSDVFVNVAGGMKLKKPAADLAVALAIASSKLKKPIPPDWVAMGELGLSGEVRMISQLDKRLKEAEKLGFRQAIIPGARKSAKIGLTITVVRGVEDAVEQVVNSE